MIAVVALTSLWWLVLDLFSARKGKTTGELVRSRETGVQRPEPDTAPRADEIRRALVFTVLTVVLAAIFLAVIGEEPTNKIVATISAVSGLLTTALALYSGRLLHLMEHRHDDERDG